MLVSSWISHIYLKSVSIRLNISLSLSQELILYAEQASGDDEVRDDYMLLHPEAEKVEKIVRTAWSNARLVAD